MRPLILVAMLGLACGSSSSSESEDLRTCFPGWWNTLPGACSIEPTCENAQGAQLQSACAASDCASISVYGYGPAGSTFWQGAAIWSPSAHLLCTRNMVSGQWDVADAGVRLTLGASSQTVEATCSGDGSDLAGLSRTRLPSDVASALDSRAADGGWSDCAY